MSKVLAWIRLNLALPIGMVLATVCVSAAWQATEIDSAKYRLLERMYLDGSPLFQAALRQQLGKSISQWECTALFRRFWTDTSELQLLPPSASEDIATARAALWDTVSQRDTFHRPPQ